MCQKSTVLIIAFIGFYGEGDKYSNLSIQKDSDPYHQKSQSHDEESDCSLAIAKHCPYAGHIADNAVTYKLLLQRLSLGECDAGRLLWLSDE